MTGVRPVGPGLHLHVVATRSNPYYHLACLGGTVRELALTNVTTLDSVAP